MARPSAPVPPRIYRARQLSVPLSTSGYLCSISIKEALERSSVTAFMNCQPLRRCMNDSDERAPCSGQRGWTATILRREARQSGQ